MGIEALLRWVFWSHEINALKWYLFLGQVIAWSFQGSELATPQKTGVLWKNCAPRERWCSLSWDGSLKKTAVFWCNDSVKGAAQICQSSGESPSKSEVCSACGLNSSGVLYMIGSATKSYCQIFWVIGLLATALWKRILDCFFREEWMHFFLGTVPIKCRSKFTSVYLYIYISHYIHCLGFIRIGRYWNIYKLHM